MHVEMVRGVRLHGGRERQGWGREGGGQADGEKRARWLARDACQLASFLFVGQLGPEEEGLISSPDRTQ